jgi:hypothetical protein
MEGPCLSTDIEIGIELGDHFFIPIIVDCHHIGHSLGVTNINSIIDGRDVESPKKLPIDRLHIHGQVILAKDNRLIPIRIKLEPKADVRIKFLLPKSGVGIPLLVHVVRPPRVVHHLDNAHLSSRTRRYRWPKDEG